ncbi:PfkB family carbohydrate kinase [Roseateles sp.]|uniref:PfkB family carbohydrate kinase n=1 Tax=Roseateles sp. TaxID=1971397 RepID=UPI003267E0A2
MSGAHLVKVSSEDLHLLCPDTPIHDVADAWLELGCSLVVVARGGEGAIAFTKRDVVHADAHPIDVVDTVGAGDTFQAALLTWLSEEGLLSIEAVSSITAAQLRSALAFASAAAAMTCTRRGADLPRRAELQA